MRHAAWFVVTFAAALAAQSPEFRVATVDGRTLSGAITVESGSLRLVPASGEPTTIGLADLVTVERTAPPTLAPAAPMCVWLRSGGVLPAVRVDGVAATADKPAHWFVETASGAKLELPQTTIAALRSRGVEPASFTVDRGAPDTNSDYLYVVKDGKPQRFRVQVTALVDGSVHFDLGGKPYDFPLAGSDSVAAIVFGKNTGFAPDQLGKPRVIASLNSGERCGGRLEAMGAETTLVLDEGARLVVPTASVMALEVASDKLCWLSTLTPRVEQVAAFDRKWPWTVDGSQAGPGIRLGGRTYSRGLVVVPRTRLTYDLGGRFDRFEATIGIDERGGPQAHAIFRVIADGKPVFESAPMQLGTMPQTIAVEVGRCRELAIEADFGKNFDLGDLCAFADARVVQR